MIEGNGIALERDPRWSILFEKPHRSESMFGKLNRLVAAVEKLAADGGQQPAHPHHMVVEHAAKPAETAPADDYTKRLMALDKAVYRGGASTDDVLAAARAFHAFLSGKTPNLTLVDKPGE